MSYEFLKWLHVLSAAVLFGGGLATLFFFIGGYRQARRVQSVEQLRWVLKLVLIADWLFSIPMVVIQPLTGHALMQAAGWPLQSDWYRIAWLLFMGIGVFWGPVLLIQHWMYARAKQAASDAHLPRTMNRWFTSCVALSVLVYLGGALMYAWMTARPQLM